MSSQRGNVKKSGPPKHQNKTAWKNVYHDTSKRTQRIVNTEVSGVCRRCKDIIDWRIKYKKYKPLTQPKTCAMCKQKTVKKAYNTYCQTCAADSGKCAKCGEKNEIILQPSDPASKQASDNSQLQLGLDMLPERKRRTFRRLQEKGMVNAEVLVRYGLEEESDGDSDSNDSDNDSDNSDVDISDLNNKIIDKVNHEPTVDIVRDSCEKDLQQLDLNKD